jgi:hypothetical protein
VDEEVPRGATSCKEEAARNPNPSQYRKQRHRKDFGSNALPAYLGGSHDTNMCIPTKPFVKVSSKRLHAVHFVWTSSRFLHQHVVSVDPRFLLPPKALL